MRVLIIGSGGREHAIAEAFIKSKKVTKVFFTGTNVGMEKIATPVNIDINNNAELLKFAKKEKIALTFVGGETALMNGVVDVFTNAGLKIFGPSKKASIIEGSKEFAKELMKKYNIPTAKYKSFDDYNEALNYVNKKGAPIVIKYDGLAAGKGVVVATTLSEAHEALEDMLLNSKFGDDKVVIEDFLEGAEFSLMALVNEDKVYALDIAQDHKRAFENDKGPNTGGMGAYSPVPMIPYGAVLEAINMIMKPTAKAMVAEGVPFTGVLYGGLILTQHGVKVIEFNARFGDPETEVVLPRLENDFYDLIEDVMEKKDVNIKFAENVVVGVVLASKGYPGDYEKGYELPKLESSDASVYHMGTTRVGDKVLSNGGRVLFVYAEGQKLLEAQKNVYSKVKELENDNMFYREDIGDKSVKEYWRYTRK